ncbi:MFS transporter [Massilia sp. TSP1-1-2]|uniref:MFS transporter n=1 Tax=unclassified Massilia TaxID=2609279 RepID=UPI003CF08886
MTSSAEQPEITSGMVLLLAFAAGVIVANLYYAQTLVGPISQATGLSAQASGLIVTLTQLGYVIGLLFIVPLGDVIENRQLVVGALAFCAAALATAAMSSSGWVFLAAALAIGIGSVAAQVLVPYAAHLSPAPRRGHVVGKVVSGLLLGIMLARPVASLVADASNWHVVFAGAAALVALLALVLRARLPRRVPEAPLPYARLIGSLWTLFAGTPLLRRRAAYQAGLFGAFSLFWTVAPLMLAGPVFHLSQTGIAIFALVGMAGAVASPVAGRLADAGHTLAATGAALALGVAGLALPLLASGSREVALGILVAASIILDMAVAANLVIGQRAIFGMAADVRSRLNGLYLACFFLGGAAGSALGGYVYATRGWHAALLAGMAFPALGLAWWLVEWKVDTGRDRALE